MNTSKLSPKKSLQRQRTQRTWTADEVRSHLEGVFTSGGRDPAKTVRDVLEDCKAEVCEPCRKAIFEKCIEALNSNYLHTQVAKEIIGKLLFEVDSLSGSSQVDVAEILIKGLKEGKHHSLELFPKIVSAIAAHKVIRYQKAGGGSGEITGLDQKSHLMNSLFGCRWDPSCILHVTDMCKDIPMHEDELEFLIQKILEMMRSLPLSEVPPLVYQLLSLSKKGHKTLVLEGIKALFNHLDQTLVTEEEEIEDSVTVSNEKELLATEGTVIVHITFAIKQDPELRKEYLKSLKVSQSRVTSDDMTQFSVSLALAAVCIHRLEDAVFGFFKDVVLKSFKDEDRKNSSRWIQDMSDDTVNIESLLMVAVKHSTSGWDHVVQGLVSVGFHLMESYGPKSASLTQGGAPQRNACLLGSKILSRTFKKHSMVHREVIGQIINRIMMNASPYVGHYINLLSEVMRTTSQVDLMTSLPKLKESLSYIALIPSHSAVDLLNSILPLVEFSSSLRDCLLLVLRKSLFSRHVDARKTAVEGYLLLLRKFTVLDSLALTDSQSSFSGSQIAVEVHAGGSGSRHGNEGLCLEILGTLRRSLTKQHNVRLSLYKGLFPVFCVNTKLAEPILDLLVGHFVKFYEGEADITPPIKLDPCVQTNDGDVSGVEPLDHLVCCIQLCVCKYLERQEAENDKVEEGEPPAIITEAQEILHSLVDRMCSSDLDDFELNRSSDFSTSSVGQKNRLFASVAMGTYETLLDYTFSTGEFSCESCDLVLKLYQGYQRLADILQDKGSSSGGGASSSHSNKRGPAAVISSRLSLRCVLRLMRAIFYDQSPNHQQSLTLLRESQQFIKYVLGVALQKIHQVHESGTCDGSFDQHKPDAVFKSFCSLAKVLFKQLDVSGGRPSKKEKGKSAAVLCLEGFSELLHTAVGRWDRVDMFLAAVNTNMEERASSNERIHYFVKHFQRLVTGVLDGSSKDWSMKETQLMINDIGLLAGKLDMGSQELNQVYEWTHCQCRDHNVDDPFITKSLISLLLTISEKHKSSVKTVRKLSQDVHYHLGDIDQEVELEAIPCYSIVNPRTAASSVLGLLYSHIDHVLVSVDWVLGRLKTEASSNPTEDNFGRPGTQVCTQSKDLCSSVCERLTHIVVACSDLVQSSVAAGPSTEGLLKTLIKLFSSLANLAKYILAIYQFTSVVQPQFRKLVNLVGTDLSQQVYALITFIQTLQVQVGGAAGSDSDRGKKGGKGRSKGALSGKATVRKESRSFPNLVYSMEQFEKYLIQLDKKAKGNLMEPFKRSTSRDFRINAQTVGNILEEDDTSGDETGDEGCDPPEAKRLKTA